VISPEVSERDVFLRSINLVMDAAEVGRIAHYRPTAKSIALLSEVLETTQERALLLVAPYGSGKSITLTYLLHAIENAPAAAEVLEVIERRAARVNPSLADTLASRRRSGQRGLVLPLHGYQANLPQAVFEAGQNALARNKLGRQARRITQTSANTMEEALAYLRQIKDVARHAGLDTICLFWDETGKHLESLVTQGKTTDLLDLQVLAEYASRSRDIPITFAVTLHHGIGHYAQQMTQAVRSEWMKISGRFQTIQYVEDSKEVYRLIAELVQAHRGQRALPSASLRKNLAKAARDVHGMFEGFTLAELSRLFAEAYPLSPAALYLLPRIASRVAQHERTLFSFVLLANLHEEIGISDLYTYFSQAMQADTAVGGVYKQWLETESAISKTAGDAAKTAALQGACLLSLGLKGERTRVQKEALVWALAAYSKQEKWAEVVSELIDRKLLLYRQHSREVSVWHGTDLDLRGHLEEEMSRNRAAFPFLKFLEAEAQPESWKPVEYNAQYAITRYWRGKYELGASLRDRVDLDDSMDIPLGRDGEILFILCCSSDELSAAREAVKKIEHPQRIFVVPKSPSDIEDAALEVWCIARMMQNASLTGDDPFILPEMQQMHDDASAYLHTVIDDFINPRNQASDWYYRGRKLPVTDAASVRSVLSEITTTVFFDTPKINNELINRSRPSGTIVNARKKLLLGMLERHGTSDLGLIPTTASASMFRTVLVHTELYRECADGTWQYSSGKTNSLFHDQGLKRVWEILRAFFSTPAEAPKRPIDLFHQLLAPPIGIRPGLFPILFTAGLKAFGKAITLKKRGEYVLDILPSVIEDLCRSPQEYTLEVLELDAHTSTYLSSVRDLFAGSLYSAHDTDDVRAAYDSIQGWLFQLPKSALTAERVSPSARRVQRILQHAAQMDPLALLLQALPDAVGCPVSNSNAVIEAYRAVKHELEDVSVTYTKRASDAIRQAIATSQTPRDIDIMHVARRWASFFPREVLSSGFPGIARSLLTRMQFEYASEIKFVNSLALLVVGKSTDDWDDHIAMDFEAKIQELIQKIESTILLINDNSHDNLSDEVRAGFQDLISERIEELYRQLGRIAGHDKSEEILTGILKGKSNGNSK